MCIIGTQLTSVLSGEGCVSPWEDPSERVINPRSHVEPMMPTDAADAEWRCPRAEANRWRELMLFNFRQGPFCREGRNVRTRYYAVFNTLRCEANS